MIMMKDQYYLKKKWRYINKKKHTHLNYAWTTQGFTTFYVNQSRVVYLCFFFKWDMFLQYLK